MGVRELWPILEPVGQPVTLHDLQGKKVAIDLSIWIRESDVIHGIGKPYLRNIFWRVQHLLRHQVTPVFVIEGAPPALKNAELERRLHGTPRKKASPTKPLNFSPRGKNAKFEEQIRESCELLDSLGVCYVHSDGEAEATCAQLNLHGMVDGCVTQDGDAFLFGAHTVYRNFTCNNQKSDQMTVYHMKDIERQLKLTRKHLVSLALLLGCDYYNGVKSVGRKYAEDFMKEIKGHDPIQRLKELRSGAFYKRLCTLGTGTKRRHCLQCQHPGSKDVHRKQGCILCKSDSGCNNNNPDHPCPCPFHVDKRQVAEHAAGIKIYKHVQHETDFPPQQVVDAFLKPTYQAPDQELEWCKPSIEKLQTFNRNHLQWGQDKVEARFVPLFTAWDLSHPEETSLLPLRILKISHDHGQKMIEVEWKYEDRSLQIGQKEAVTTKEFYDVMSDVHPDLVSGFEAEQKKTPKSAKTPAKRKMLKAAAESHNISDMLKRKKPKIEAAAGKANHDVMDLTEEATIINGKHSSKPKDSKPDIEAATGKAEESVETMKGESQANGNNSNNHKDTKPGARKSLFSQFEGLLQKDSSKETSVEEDSSELPDISIALGKKGPPKNLEKSANQKAVTNDAIDVKNSVNILRKSPVPMPNLANSGKTALSDAKSQVLSSENGESDAKSPMDTSKPNTFDIPDSGDSDNSLELILDTASESSITMETNAGEGPNGRRKDGVSNDEGHGNKGLTAEGQTTEGYTNGGHDNKICTYDVGATVPPGGDIHMLAESHAHNGGVDSDKINPSLEEQPSRNSSTEVPTTSAKNGSGSGQGPAVNNGSEGLNDNSCKDEGYTQGSNEEGDRETKKTGETNSNGNDKGSAIAFTKPKNTSEISNLGDEDNEDGGVDSDDDIFVVKQSQPETSTGDQPNGTVEEHEGPKLRKRATKKEPVVKPKVKNRGRKKLKDCPGQLKIKDMFSVKKQSDGAGLKMVLVRKSDV